MSLHIEVGNLIHLVKKDQLVRESVIVHGCNCLGVMGAGFALELARAFPGVADVDRKHCTNKLRFQGPADVLGTFSVYEHLTPSVTIGNLYTQVGTRVGTKPPFELHALDKALRSFIQNQRLTCRPGLDKIHMPRIGAGLGGGDWKDIEDLLLLLSEELRISFHVYVLPQSLI